MAGRFRLFRRPSDAIRRILSTIPLLLMLPGGAGAEPPPTLAGCEMFPAQAIFNQRIDDVSRFPVHARSAEWINMVGASRSLHPDWGSETDPAASRYYGMPWNVVDGTERTTRWPLVSHSIVDSRDGNGGGALDESDCAVVEQGRVSVVRPCERAIASRRRFPFPVERQIKVEGSRCEESHRCGDRHVLVLESGVGGACRLWESYFSYQDGSGRWSAYATAAWDLKSLAMRPEGWTSSDAAGLPVLPLLLRAEEVETGAVRHALRVTFRDAVLDRRHVWPARHAAGTPTSGGIPFGALLRLSSDFEIPFWWNEQSRTIARAMQKYGLYVADIGSDFFVQGDPDERWSLVTMMTLRLLKMQHFEFVDLGAITRHPRFDPDSFAASW
ncbi:MAG: hypothetical protein RLZZ592_2493 [Pseudomonadota bacterium]